MEFNSGQLLLREKLSKRLKELQQEFDAGQKVMAELKAKQRNLRHTLLRISGAIQVLEEELAKLNGDNGKSESSQPALVEMENAS